MNAVNAAAQRRSLSLDQLVAEISRLPADWHLAGTMSESVLRAIARYSNKGGFAWSVETGSGKTTLLFSHLSRDHKSSRRKATAAYNRGPRFSFIGA